MQCIGPVGVHQTEPVFGDLGHVWMVHGMVDFGMGCLGAVFDRWSSSIDFFYIREQAKQGLDLYI